MMPGETSPRLFIEAYGLINALGHGARAVAGNWCRGTSPGMTDTELLPSGQTIVVGAVTGELEPLPAALDIFECRNNRLLIETAKQIRPAVAAAKMRYGEHRIGVVLATCTSGIAEVEQAVRKYRQTRVHPADFQFAQQDLGAGARLLRQYIGVSGPATTVSTACSSSGNAFAAAQHLIAMDFCDAVIVGGTDSLCQLTVQGFAALKSVSRTRCQPFSSNRAGINVGEGSALFLLSREPSSLELYAVGTSSDAYHVSAPEPNGQGAKTAIGQALERARLTAADIDYINLHGTATRLNDLVESAIVNELFGPETRCSSTKSLTGHTLAAASATELGFCAMLLDGSIAPGYVPPQVWDGQFDRELAPINIVSESTVYDPVKVCMSNSFAFGGSNATLILGHRRETLTNNQGNRSH